jgi:hypothetical protein
MSLTWAAGGASLDQQDGDPHAGATRSRPGLLAYRRATRITGNRHDTRMTDVSTAGPGPSSRYAILQGTLAITSWRRLRRVPDRGDRPGKEEPGRCFVPSERPLTDKDPRP